MMCFHFDGNLFAQRFPVSGSEILPVKEDRVVSYLVLEMLLLLTCIFVCVCVVGMELLSHSFYKGTWRHTVCQICMGHGNAWVTMKVTSLCTQGTYRSRWKRRVCNSISNSTSGDKENERSNGTE